MHHIHKHYGRNYQTARLMNRYGDMEYTLILLNEQLSEEHSYPVAWMIGAQIRRAIQTGTDHYPNAAY